MILPMGYPRIRMRRILPVCLPIPVRRVASGRYPRVTTMQYTVHAYGRPVPFSASLYTTAHTLAPNVEIVG